MSSPLPPNSKIGQESPINEAVPSAELSYVAGTHRAKLNDIEVLHQRPGSSYENHIKLF